MDTANQSVFARTKAAITGKGAELRQLCPVSARLIDSTLKDLEENRFDIAVTGVFNSGKSTLLNVLMLRPSLLPSDQNPWTAVVTRLHFGNHERQQGAVFRFLTREEWAVLRQSPANEGEESRLLRAQTVERAQRRLGNELDGLLGTTRRLDEEIKDRRMLEPYLTASEGEPNRPDAGKYSAITGDAELYFPTVPFDEYCTLVDTPGLNDPCTSRSKKTEDYVDRAQAFVFIMMANQAGTKYDMDFLKRIVMGRYKERLIVVVNQIDGLNDPARDWRRVQDRVEGILHQEFPKVRIPVVTTSALWAAEAQEGDDDALCALLDRKFEAYGIARGYFSADEVKTWRADPAGCSSQIRDAAVRVSGMREVLARIEETLLRVKGLAILEAARGGIASVSTTASEDRAAQATALGEKVRLLETDRESAERDLARLKSRIEGLESQKQEVSARVDGLQERVSEVVQRPLDRLGDTLAGIVKKFATDQSDPIRRGISISDERHRTVDLAACRGNMESAFRAGCEDLKRLLGQELLREQRGLRRELGKLADEVGLNEDLALGTRDLKPSMGALRQHLQIDLGDWWDRLWANGHDARKKADECYDGIIAALNPVYKELVEGATDALEERFVAATEEFQVAVQAAIDRLGRDLEEQRALLDRALREKDPAKLAAQAEENRQRVADLKAEAEKLRGFTAQVLAIELPAA